MFWLIVLWLTPHGDAVRSERQFDTKIECQVAADHLVKMVHRDIRVLCVERVKTS